MVDARGELLQHLHEQIGLLDLYADGFDAGKEILMLPASTALRVLIHGPRSLLAQLDAMEEFPFYDSRDEQVRQLSRRPMGMFAGLAVAELSQDEVKWAPLFRALGIMKNPAPFTQWWSDKVVDDGSGTYYSRRNLVLGSANKDGGAHVDLDKQEHKRIPRDGLTGVVFRDVRFADGHNPSPIPACVRHIVEEVRSGCRDYLASERA